MSSPSPRRAPRTRLGAALATCLAVVTAALALAPSAPASASSTQLGAPQVTINPGGGMSANGDDGLKIVVNDAGEWTGQDQLWFAGTNQYCCSAGAPMLNVGGTLFGQAGPAYSAVSWASLTVDATSGSTTTDAGTAIGSGTARLTYTATKNALVYTVVRTLSYTYPNSYVSDSYAFTIPDGNTDTVKFYLGGDTAPGSSDIGYGIMLTDPVRSVISLNPDSHIQFGLREVAGDRAFDGARSGSFYQPYQPVQTGADIPFAVDANLHDAGLMVEWNLGASAGTTTAKLEQFVTYQESSLSAQFRHSSFDYTTEEPFDFNLTNTFLTPTSGQGFTFTFPNGMAVGTGALVNTCGGTVTAVPGTTTVVMAGVAIPAASNCVLTVPVAVVGPGNFAVSATSISNLVGGIAARVASTTTAVVSSTNLAPSWIDDALGVMAQGVYYDNGLVTSGWPLPTFAVTTGALPAGLSLDTDTGAVTGIPTAAGAYDVTVTVSNGQGSALVKRFTGTVLAAPAAPAWTDDTLAAPVAGQAYADGVAASGSPTVTYSVSSGALPDGLTLDAGTGAVTGTPTTTGAYAFELRAVNGVGTAATANFVGTVHRAPVWTHETLAAFHEGVAYTDGLTVDADPLPTFTLTAGALPSGVSLDAATGALTGVPTMPGAYSFTITVANGTTPDLVKVFSGVVLAARAPAVGVDLQLRVGAGRGGEGARALVHGQGLRPGSPYVVEMHSDPIVLATGTVGGDGTFEASVTIPADAPAGAHTLVVTSTAPSGDTTSSQAYFAISGNGTIGDASPDGPLSADLGYTPLVPTRVLDTRETDAPIAAGSERAITVVSLGGVPADATAVVLDVAAVGATEDGFVTVHPCGVERPWASNVNVVGGRIVANAVTSAIGTDGRVCVYSSVATHVVVDLEGVYSASTGVGRVHGLTPTRLVDTRTEGSLLAAGTVRPSPVRGRGGVAAHATAAVLNVTATEATGDGFLTVFPCADGSLPLASNVNLAAGQTVANAVTVGLAGDVCVYASVATHLIIDVTADYRSDERLGADLHAPIRRLVDTRESDGPTAGAPMPGGRVLALRLPAGVVSAVLNVTLVDAAGRGFATVYPGDVERPLASNVNVVEGQTVANQVTVPVGAGGVVHVYVSTTAHVVVDLDAAFGAGAPV